MASKKISLEKNEQKNKSTPKLSLSKLPKVSLRDHHHPSQLMDTPPLHKLASIPFQWEEVPGKPKPDLITTTAVSPRSHHNTTTSSVVRCLDLPPRLKTQSVSVSILCSKSIDADSSSPTAVLEGPDGDSSAFSDKTVSFRSLDHEEGIVRGDHHVTIKEKSKLKSSSWRWPGSFKEIRGVTAAGDNRSFYSCTIVSSPKNLHRSSSSKLSRIKRRSSFLNISHSGSNLLSSVYGSLKQVVLWRRSQD